MAFVHAGSTSRNLAAFFHTIQLTPAIRLDLAHHIIIVVCFTSCTDEEGGTEKRRRAGSELFDLGDVVGKRGGIDEVLVVEPTLN